MGDEAGMAAWAIKHRDFVKELIINQEERGGQEFNRDWLVVSTVVAVCQLCPLFVPLASHSALTEASLC